MEKRLWQILEFKKECVKNKERIGIVGGCIRAKTEFFYIKEKMPSLISELNRGGIDSLTKMRKCEVII